MLRRPKYLFSCTIVIGLIFIYNSFGYLLLFNPLKILIKEVIQKTIIENKIHTEGLSTLVFNLNDLNNNGYDLIWVGGDEFRFNSKMYDIKEKVIKGDSLYLICYYDHKENTLESLFALFLANNKKDANHNPTSTIFLFGFFYEEASDIYSQYFENDITSIPLLKTENGILNFIKDIPSPPPRFVV